MALSSHLQVLVPHERHILPSSVSGTWSLLGQVSHYISLRTLEKVRTVILPARVRPT